VGERAGRGKGEEEEEEAAESECHRTASDEEASSEEGVWC
jgi:hypothetical protein